MRYFVLGLLFGICVINIHADIMGKDAYIQWVENSWIDTHWSHWLWVMLLTLYVTAQFDKVASNFRNLWLKIKESFFCNCEVDLNRDDKPVCKKCGQNLDYITPTLSRRKLVHPAAKPWYLRRAKKQLKKQLNEAFKKIIGKR